MSTSAPFSSLRNVVWTHRLMLLSGVACLGGAVPLFLPPVLLGYDSMSHVAKTSFLMYSWLHGNFLGWSGFWYGGFQLLGTYPPLFDIAAAVLGLLSGGAEMGGKLLVMFSLFVSGLSVFSLARDFGIKAKWSFAAGLAYVYSPAFLLFLYDYGSLTYALAFALAPIVFLALRRMMRETSLKSAVIFGVAAALLVLANVETVVVLLYPLIAYLLITTARARAKRLAGVLLVAAGLSFLLVAFWLVPYLQLGETSMSNLLWSPPSGSYSASEIITIWSMFTPNLTALSHGFLGYLIIPAMASLFFVRRRDEIGLVVATLVAVLLTLGASMTDLFYRIPFVLLLQFPKRFLVADVLFLCLLTALFFDKTFQTISRSSHKGPMSPKGLRIMVVLLICGLVAVPISLAPMPNWSQVSSPAEMTPEVRQAYSFLSSQPGYFRVMVYDRYYAWVPMYTLKGSIDGWYDQAVSTLYRNFTYDLYYIGEGNVNLTTNALRLLGVRYIVVFANYGDGQWALSVYNSSVYAPPVFHNDQVSIYEVPNSGLVYFAGAAVSFDLPYADVAHAAASIAMDPRFSPEGFALVEGGCGAASMNATCFPQSLGLNPAPFGYSISDLSWTETEISFRLNTSAAGYAVVSSSYSPGWTAELDGHGVAIWTGIPNEMVIQVSSSGLHTVVIRYLPTPIDETTSITSASAWLALAVFAVLSVARRERRRT